MLARHSLLFAIKTPNLDNVYFGLLLLRYAPLLLFYHFRDEPQLNATNYPSRPLGRVFCLLSRAASLFVSVALVCRVRRYVIDQIATRVAQGISCVPINVATQSNCQYTRNDLFGKTCDAFVESN